VAPSQEPLSLIKLRERQSHPQYEMQEWLQRQYLTELYVW